MATTANIEAALFRRVLGHYPTGVCVITAIEEGPVGMAVGSFTSVSLDPPLIAFFPDKRSSSWPRIARAGRFCVNVLVDDQLDVCKRFAVSGGDKFGGITHCASTNGSPVLDGVVAWIDCNLHGVSDAGDHLMALGYVQNLEAVGIERSTAVLSGLLRRFSQA